MAKPMEDGSLAVGLFNLAEFAREIEADWSLLGVRGKQRIRDLWRQKDLGTFNKSFARRLPRHGVALLQFRPD
jgi:alpha-galactosidase